MPRLHLQAGAWAVNAAALLGRFVIKTRLAPSGCLEWVGGKHRDGYGLTFVGKGVSRLAHRIAYQLIHGPVPRDLLVCHRCNNPACVNVDHLYVGTQQDNMADREAAGRNGARIFRASQRAAGLRQEACQAGGCTGKRVYRRYCTRHYYQHVRCTWKKEHPP